MIGKHLSHFHILEKIDEGGMGVVYRAHDDKLGRAVALKILHPEFMADEERRLRFVREARTAAAITHANIATIHEIGEDEGVIFIAMELVEGQKLGRRIDGRPLTSDETLQLAVEIAEGLTAAHQSAVVHRDLKPDNLMICADGHVKILDFGLAKIYGREDPISGKTGAQTISAEMTREGRILGTVAYMSPEQARGLAVDARSDIFSFGVVLFEMVTGNKPFKGQTITDTLSAILRDEQPPIAQFNPQAPAELERIIARCLEKEADARYADAAELLADLRSLKRISDSHSQPIPLVSDSGTVARAARPLWLRPVPLIAAAALLVVAVVVGPRLMRGGGGPPVTALANSLAVLPFDNLQDAADSGRYGQILQELIITDLSEMAGLTVLSSQRLFDIQKQLGRGDRPTIDRDMVSEVASRAGAATMLTGTVNPRGDEWTLTAQLVDVTSGAVIESERIEGADLYSLVDDLTGRLRGDLGVVADSAAGDMAVTERTSSSIEAYQTFLQGQEQLNALDFAGAAEAFQRAVDIDPDFGTAYYKLAIAKWWAKSLDGHYPDEKGGEPQLILQSVLDGSLKQTAKDRNLAEAFHALVSYEYEEADTRFEQLVASYPDEKEAWYGLGEALRHGKSGRSPETLEAFEKAIELDPSFHLAYYHAVEIYADQQMYDAGIASVEGLLEAHPSDANWRAQMAKLLILKGDEDRTVEMIDESLGLITEPEARQRFLVGLAEDYSSRIKIDEARRYLEQALAIETEHGTRDALLTLGRLQTHLHEFDAAEESLTRALNEDPRSPRALEQLLELYGMQRRYDAALKTLRGLIGDDPGFAPYHELWLAVAISSGNEDEIRAARRSVDEILRLDSTTDRQRGRILNTAYQALRRMENYVEAEKYARELHEIDPASAEWSGVRGWAAFNLGDHDEAAEWFAEALEHDAKQPLAIEGTIHVALQRENYDEATKLSKHLIETVPDWFAARRLLLGSYLRAGRTEEAEILVESALQDCGVEVQRLEWLSDSAETYLKAGYPEAAEALARRALAILSGARQPQPGSVLAWSLLRQGRHEDAERELRLSLAETPDDWTLNALKAAAELMRKDFGGAERRLRGILRTGPAHHALYALLATSLAEQGRFEEARGYARTGVEMSPDRRGQSLLAWLLIAGDLDLDEGIEIARHAMTLPIDLEDGAKRFPFQPSAEHALGLAHLKRGEYDRAAQVLQQAADLQPERTAVREHLDQAISKQAWASH